VNRPMEKVRGKEASFLDWLFESDDHEALAVAERLGDVVDAAYDAGFMAGQESEARAVLEPRGWWQQ
jgi:hypothetical protein